MRIKALLSLAALAACAVTASAQVYSANVVGYVNKSFDTAGAYYLMGAPFKAGAQTLNDVMPTAPDYSSIAFWDVATQDVNMSVLPVFYPGTGWDPNPVVNPGEGFFFIPGAACTQTLVGEVPQGTLTCPVTVPGSGAYAALSALTSVSGSINTVLQGYAASDYDSLALWDPATQDVNMTTLPVYYPGTGWDPDYSFAAGEGFFLIRSGGSYTWSYSFTVAP